MPTIVSMINGRISISLLVLGLILMSGCDNSSTETSSQLNTKEEAQKTAERFARYWEQKDASSMYGLFIPELQEKRNKEDFVKFFGASENLTNPVIRLDQ